MLVTDWITLLSIAVGIIGSILTAYSIKVSKNNRDTTGSDQSSDSLSCRMASERETSKRIIVGVSLVLCCAVLWGGSHVLAKHIMIQSLNPFLAIFLRNCIAALTIATFVFLMRPFSRSKRVKIAMNRNSALMIGGRAFAGIFYFMSIQYITATEAISLYKFNAISSFVMTLYLLNRKIPKLTTEVVAVGVMVTICGVFVATIGGKTLNEAFTSPNFAGYIFIILAAISWSVFSVFSEKDQRSNCSKTDLVTRQSYMAKILFYSSLPALFIYLISSYYRPDNSIALLFVDHDSGKAIMVLGILTGVVGIMYFEALKRISPMLVTVVVSFEILVTAVLEKAFIGLNLSWYLVVGAVLILLGSFLVARESESLRLSKDT